MSTAEFVHVPKPQGRPTCDLCPKPAKLSFGLDNGRIVYRCNRHSKPLLGLQKHGTMAIPKGGK